MLVESGDLGWSLVVSVFYASYTLTHCGFTLPTSGSNNVVLIAGRSRELADKSMSERAQLGIFSGLFSASTRLSHCTDPAYERVECSSGYLVLRFNLLLVQYIPK